MFFFVHLHAPSREISKRSNDMRKACTLVSRLEATCTPSSFCRAYNGVLLHAFNVDSWASARWPRASLRACPSVHFDLAFVSPKGGGGGGGDGACVSCGLSSSTPTWHVRVNLQPSTLMWSLLCCTLVVGPIYTCVHSQPVLVRSVNACLDACVPWRVQLAFERVYTHQRAQSRHTDSMHVVCWNKARQAPSTASRRRAPQAP